MEKVSEILNNIKDRLSNPLIFSFLLSWLIYNWEITVALVWYDKSQIKACGCNSIFDFIIHQLSKEGSFRYPVIFAICYTFLVPLIKSIIKLFNTWVTKFTDDKELEILDGGKIGIDKYLKLREEYNIKIKAHIKEFYFDSNSGGVFILMNYDKSFIDNEDEYPEYLFSILKIDNDNWNYLSGMENNVKVEYRKIITS